MLAEGGDEDHRRHAHVADGAQDSETVDLRHLHVEEEDVRPAGPDGLHRAGTVAAHADQLHVPLAVQQLAESAPGQRLVVHHQGAEPGAAHDRAAGR